MRKLQAELQLFRICWFCFSLSAVGWGLTLSQTLFWFRHSPQWSGSDFYCFLQGSVSSRLFISKERHRSRLGQNKLIIFSIKSGLQFVFEHKHHDSPWKLSYFSSPVPFYLLSPFQDSYRTIFGIFTCSQVKLSMGLPLSLPCQEFPWRSQ